MIKGCSPASVENTEEYGYSVTYTVLRCQLSVRSYAVVFCRM